MPRLRSGVVVVSLGLLGAAHVSEAADPNLSKLDVGLRRELALGARVGAPPTVAMFVQTRDVARTTAEVLRAGGSVGTVAGDILTVRVPRASIATLAATAAVSRLEGARAVHAKLDRALPETKADQVHAGGGGLPSPYKGAGVVVGVIDYGMDAGHEAFRKGGASRLLGLWDQTLTAGGTAPTGFNYGVACDNAQLSGNTCPHNDNGDHGTHVAGIAAGGPVTGTPYVGMAPESDLVFVHLGAAPGKPTNEEALTTAICDGASYIFKVAEAAGKPAVINMSLGEHSGPHDGTSLADQCLDNLTGPGKIIVAAAGNEGQGSQSPATGNPRVYVHATGTATGTPQVFLHKPGVRGNTATSEIYIWWDAPGDLSVRLGVDDGGAGVWTTAVTTAAPFAAAQLTVGTAQLGPVSGVGASLANGTRTINFTIADTNNDAAEVAPNWMLEITGTGRFDAFIDTTQASGFLQTNVPAGATVDNAMTIGFPAVASKVLAVGSYVTRNAWTPFDADAGEQQQRDSITNQQVVVGALSGFSSRGPVRKTGTVGNKPDVAAPGEIIVSALNSRHTLANQSRLMRPSPNGFFLAEGTSMATPAVAGIVALMLQRNPRLTVADIRTIFDTSSVVPNGVTVPSTDWGRGKINALAAVLAAQSGASPDAGRPSDDAGVIGGPNPPGPDAGAPAAKPADSGCGCGVPPGSATWLSAAVFGVGLLALARRRRARRN